MPSSNVIDLTTLSISAGYVTLGTAVGGLAEKWVPNAGDINGDGIADLLIGAPGMGGDAARAGRVHAMFDTTDPLHRVCDLAAFKPTGGRGIVGDFRFW